MKKIILILAAAMFATGCTNYDGPLEPVVSGANVKFAISSEITMEAATRTVDEYEVRNFHLFLFGKNNAKKYHVAGFTSIIEMTIDMGDYDVFAVANHDGVDGDFTVERLKSLRFDFLHTPELEILPMSYEGTISIPPVGKTTVNIHLVRSVAKLMINLSNGSDRYVEVISAMIYNVPVKGSLFYDGDLTMLDASDYTAMDITDRLVFKDNGKDSGYGVYSTFVYMPENRRGINSAITHQFGKIAENAPENATYLHVKAKRPGGGLNVVDYYVYLGENNTSDFNIRRNSRLSYTMTMISGRTTVDTRVRTYFLFYEWDMVYGSKVSKYSYANTHALDFLTYLSSADPDVRVHVKYEFSPSDRDGLLIDYKKPESLIIEGTYAPEQQKRFLCGYNLPYYHDGNNKMQLAITISDNWGYSFTDYIQFTYFNKTFVVSWHDGLASRGTVEIENAELYHAYNYSLYDSWTIYYDGGGCDLKALPEPGYKFIGWYKCWYKGGEYSDFLSDKPEYHYNPLNASTDISARFEPI